MQDRAAGQVLGGGDIEESPGGVTNHYRGYFSGDGGIMNMTMTLTSSCDDIDIRGEMRR